LAGKGRKMKIIILAAGYAVRLQPLTLNMPKSLLPVGGRTIVDRILDKIDPVKGWDAIYIVTNAKYTPNFDQWHKTARHKDKITVINDGSTNNDNRLGAINDMALVIKDKSIDDDTLVVAGDNLFDFDLGAFLEFAHSKPDGVSVALYDVKSIDLARSYGIVELGKDDRIVNFEEKPQEPRSTLSSTGIYYFPKNKVPFIEKYVKMRDKLDAPGYYIGWLSRIDKVYGFRFLEDWYDIGNIESYKKADKKYTERES
jgi:Nucleoside-diphosphate-sugar pyrophosphorylase involved in lipopolysaccharide biosynthesis/translation initiation factor 2B, gamma/epsilon subunits (eIF-2Bgamma/eIF-2Bepsilon)